MRAVGGTVRGRVQGVGFRYSTLHEANRLGLTGWVRNARDGSVEVHAQGDPAILARFVEYLHAGPRGARVESVTLDDAAIDDSLDRFEIR